VKIGEDVSVAGYAVFVDVGEPTCVREQVPQSNAIGPVWQCGKVSRYASVHVQLALSARHCLIKRLYGWFAQSTGITKPFCHASTPL
jgi:hypothetical protein